MVLQDGVGPVVARGDADADYRFVVDVPITGPLHPGTVTIAARAADPRPQFAFGPEIPVAEGAAAAVTPTTTEPVLFADSPNPAASSGDDGTTGRRWLVGGAVLLVAVAGGLVWWGRRPPSDGRGDEPRSV